jgi:hypothetical protein
MIWLAANWKIILAVAVLSFGAGLYVRGYIATAETNKTTIDAQNQKMDKEQKGNEKLAEIERKNTKVRETSRAVASQLAKNRGTHGNRSSCVVSPDGVSGINAIRRANDSRFNQ